MKKIFNVLVLLLPALASNAQNIQNNPQSNHGNKFEQLGIILNDPNEYRTASGAPGNKYWQQRADYEIDAVLDEKNFILQGTEWVTYYNNSPDPLNYLWLQLDENEHNPKSDNFNFDGEKIEAPVTNNDLNRLLKSEALKEYGDRIVEITDKKGRPLKYTINQTMMRIDLPKMLKAGAKIKFKVRWNYKIINRIKYGGRGGYEYFPEDGNSLFTMAQWFPRMCVYSDFQGWQNKQFTGRGEFALVFGNYKVKMTVPSDHIVAATGVCVNYPQVLTPVQLQRWQKAQSATDVVEIVTLDEAKEAEKNKASGTKTWVFTADSVRDFAWTSSRKYMWDAMPVKTDNKKTMCMSLYAKEAYGLYRRFSTKAIAHTIKTYSKYTIPYPYPVAQSIEAASGMEYPMICFNFGRTEKDGTYSEGTKNGMLGVIIHEVGHNFFPMIVNSDERQWAWMDEGLNTFMENITEQEFDPNFPANRGAAHKIVDYMKLPKDQLEPIMTNSENIVQYGNNAYAKPSVGLVILRETVMGRELFDYAFKEYARRWAFKHPTPNDFFRTMEDASGVDLDWFWRGWFFGIDPVDIALDSVKAFTVNNTQVIPVKADTIPNRFFQPRQDFEHITKIRNRESGMKFLVDVDTTLRDFYYYYKPESSGSANRPDKIVRSFADQYEALPDSLATPLTSKYYYELNFSNKGGMVMPIIIQWNYKDGSTEIERINAYIWRKNEKQVTKTFAKNKEVASIIIDPYRETADINEKNNGWNLKEAPAKFDVFKAKFSGRGQSNSGNPMQKQKKK